MTTSRLAAPALAMALLATLAGCASHPTTPGQAQAQAQAGTPLAAARAPLTQAPALKVLLDCGDCQVGATVHRYILEGYQAAAAKAGLKIDPAQQATLTIKSFRERDPGVRLMTGIFSGKDEIRAEVSWQGRTAVVEEYYRNAWLGIGSVAENIGQMAFEEISR